ncbi:hypothetical protein M2323_004099 [Rhodoblastus acidophilus]|uniref:hypothetical protein n=1 Tax=Rhodoblastus acidophilus TaxID=1074 RepID=UPI002224E62D|nr:hypothetical protein [Rhodoblastus acidophilus]MCW2286266.1 hypothetical protein [Rhodoblastus acidophilus]MCW2335154.1 hypothetical protein [Rhodoblastus acidophilus]
MATTRISLVLLSGIALAFGLAFVFAPGKFGAVLGLETSGSVAALGRLMGAAMLAWGLILWSARRFDAEAQAAVLRATGFADAVGAAAALVASVSGAMNVFGGIVALVFLCGAMACMGLSMRERRAAAEAEGVILHNYE